MSTNIDYWEKVLQGPTEPFQNLFNKEIEYLRAKIDNNSKVLEIGCGNGRNIKSIIDITSNIVGIDNDTRAVRDTRQNLSQHSNVKVLLADALNLPFENLSFDVVLLMNTLVNFKENKVRALKEMRRVLKNSGKIIISVYSEKAFDTRIRMYEKIGVPIEKTEGTKVIFYESVGANESEQFTQEQLTSLARESGLEVTDCVEVNDIAYICTLTADR